VWSLQLRRCAVSLAALQECSAVERWTHRQRIMPVANAGLPSGCIEHSLHALQLELLDHLYCIVSVVSISITKERSILLDGKLSMALPLFRASTYMSIIYHLTHLIPLSTQLNTITASLYIHSNSTWESAQERSESPANTEHATEPPSVSSSARSKSPNTPHTVVPSAERTRSSVPLLEFGLVEVVKRRLRVVRIV